MCGRIAALLIRMSTRPNSDSALAASASTSAFLPTSASIGTALTPRSRASRATASASCRLERALTTICAPSPASFSTVARPILRPDPVTSATFPSSLPMPLSLLQCLHRTPHLGSDVKSIFTCAKAVEHVAADCIARMDFRAFLPIPEIDFNRIDQEGFLSERNELPMYQCFSRKLSSHEAAPTAGLRRCRITAAGREMSRGGLEIVQRTLMTPLQTSISPQGGGRPGAAKAASSVLSGKQGA